MKVILISGGAPRKNDDHSTAGWLGVLYKHVRKYLTEQAPDLVIVGDALGVDECAIIFCRRKGIAAHHCPAYWKVQFKKAGPIRNKSMLRTGLAYKSDCQEVRLGAFPGPRSVGTWNMIEDCEAAGIPVDKFGPWSKERP